MVSFKSILGAAAGTAIGSAVRGVAALRAAAKPLHPRGRIREARLMRFGVAPPSGVPFLDAEATDDVLVRESRAIGLPGPLPDIHGLALRVPNADGSHGDLLLATTGFGRLTRFVLTASRSPYGRPLTTLLPYDTAAGPVLLGARATAPSLVELSFAVTDGPWQPFAALEISEQEREDALTFDPVLNTLPGLRQYDAVRRLREPGYRAARSSRDGN